MINVGTHVEHETDNNGPIYHGVVEEIRKNGLAYVRWEDGSPLRTYMATTQLTPSLMECAACLESNEDGEPITCGHPICPNRHLWATSGNGTEEKSHE